MLEPVKEGLLVLLVQVAPTVVTAASIGLIIGLIQAATQIQDQTIPTALKLVGIAIVLIIFAPFMFKSISTFTNKTFTKAFSVVLEKRKPIIPAVSVALEKRESATLSTLSTPAIPATPIAISSKKSKLALVPRTALPSLDSFSLITKISESRVSEEKKNSEKKKNKKKKNSKKRKRLVNKTNRERERKRSFYKKRAPKKQKVQKVQRIPEPTNSSSKKSPVKSSLKLNSVLIRPVIPEKSGEDGSELRAPTRKVSPEDWW